MLKVIYAVFVGLLLAIFVGVGINAFYPGPTYPEAPEMLAYPPKGAPDGGEVQNDAQRQYDRDVKVYQRKAAVYNRNVSIITLVAAIIFVAVSLIFEGRIKIIADGVLLGGLFTLLYSIIRSFESSDDKYVFLVVSVGLVVALLLGYVRFIRPQEQLAGTGRKAKR